mgnify:CR=1 FL=1
MNRSIVRFLIAKLLLIEAALLVVPLIVALIYQEDAKVFASILGTMGILFFLGVLGTLFKPKNYHIYTKEGMLIVASVGCSGLSLEDCPSSLLVRSQVSLMPFSR